MMSRRGPEALPIAVAILRNKCAAKIRGWPAGWDRLFDDPACLACPGCASRPVAGLLRCSDFSDDDRPRRTHAPAGFAFVVRAHRARASRWLLPLEIRWPWIRKGTRSEERRVGKEGR